MIAEPKVCQNIQIDRSKPLNLKFIKTENDLVIEKEDRRSISLTEIDPMRIRLKTTFKEGETHVFGEENLKRLGELHYICLDAKILQTFFENQELIPESWKEKTNGIGTFIFFFGTVFINPRGERFVLSLFWHGGMWRVIYRCLSYDLNGNNPSAILDLN